MSNRFPQSLYRQHLADWIRKQRKAQGIGQGELAEKMGVTQATLSRIESADAALTFDNVEPIIKALGGGEICIRIGNSEMTVGVTPCQKVK
ncbi:hypothetical protein HMF8227_01444 [Saliniradius amylolyticus]|uniref:HTH cro/C1-type domain-containing protein n=1 Tax=Saliniradius amylolyticus TaxID=2183582 RepID=A0A2S2E2V0_9ALTE|nr:helix-turn-helix transcriptional regulator [Saliniradius amylolyticus]AWL11919.1 hypothetical protein HMF8227_01444 [Saliniradius amylolyticus]